MLKLIINALYDFGSKNIFIIFIWYIGMPSTSKNKFFLSMVNTINRGKIDNFDLFKYCSKKHTTSFLHYAGT